MLGNRDDRLQLVKLHGRALTRYAGRSPKPESSSGIESECSAQAADGSDGHARQHERG